MTDQHPITPPPELVEQLRKDAPRDIRDAGVTRERHLVIAAYCAGADQELEACMEWMRSHFHGVPQWADELRAVLARWGNPVPPPAYGEVAELVKMLKGISYWRRHGKPGEPAPTSFDIRQADRLDRAAELLQRQVLVPVSVSERLPGAEETTEDGEVWIEDPGHDYPLADTGDYDWEPHRWVLRQIGKFDAKNNLHWLPAHALPLPEVGE